MFNGRLPEVKNNGNFQTVRPKSGRLREAVVYAKWSLTGGFNCSEFIGEILVFWKKVVAHGRFFCITSLLFHPRNLLSVSFLKRF